MSQHTDIQKVDQDNELDMYHFEDGKETNFAPKGLVTDKNNNTVCHTSVYTFEYDINGPNGVVEEGIDWSTALVLQAEEGTLLRVFAVEVSNEEYKYKWYVSTHKKLDSYGSRWGCKYSFRQLFNRAVQDALNISDPNEFFDKLDPNLVYTFLLRNNASNRIVCDSPSADEPKVYFTGLYKKGGSIDFIPIPSMGDWTISEIPNVKQYTVNSLEEVKEIVNDMSCQKHQGLVVFTPEKVFKVLCDKYLDLRKVRDNCSNMLFRYVQLRQTDMEMCNTLVNMFPTYSMDFAQFENTLQKVAYYVSLQYINRYVKKRYASVTPLQYKITKKIREWYLLDPMNNRVTPPVVFDFINKESPIYLYKLVTDFDQFTKDATVPVQ